MTRVAGRLGLGFALLVALPDGLTLGQVSGVAVDSRGNVYTAEVGTGRRVQKFVTSCVPAS